MHSCLRNRKHQTHQTRLDKGSELYNRLKKLWLTDNEVNERKSDGAIIFIGALKNELYKHDFSENEYLP